MKPPFSILLTCIVLAFAIGLTLVSQNFVRPTDCRGLCDAANQAACPSETWLAGEQRAGLPLPYRVDDPGGGSPTNGWKILGKEDLANPITFGLDVLFYACLLWLGWYAFCMLRRRRLGQRPDLWAIVLPLALVLAGPAGADCTRGSRTAS